MKNEQKGTCSHAEAAESHSPLEGCLKGGVEIIPEYMNQPALFDYMKLPKDRELAPRARELRQQGILAEVVFWCRFKDKRKLGWDIDRQVIIGSYIVDFFIPELGFVVEIDDSSHNSKVAYDNTRDIYLKSWGLEVVHVQDKEVLNNIQGVWAHINKKIDKRVKDLSTTALGDSQEK